MEQIEIAEERLGSGVDMSENIAAEEHRDVVSIQDRLGRIARKADRVDEHAHRCSLRPRGASIDGQVVVGEAWYVSAEVRQPPRHGHAEPGGSSRETALELPERVLERRLGVSEVGGSRLDSQPRRHHAVVERRHDDLDRVVEDQLCAVEQMLLRR
jgi:hypothetical protein